MALKEIADYFTGTATAGYTATTLTVKPQKIVVETYDKNQIVHEADDGTIAVTTLSGTKTIVEVTLQWTMISSIDAGTILDFYASSSKANGRATTFYWEHPTDGHTYVARFMSPLERLLHVKLKTSFQEISQVKLRIEGVKA